MSRNRRAVAGQVREGDDAGAAPSNRGTTISKFSRSVRPATAPSSRRTRRAATRRVRRDEHDPRVATEGFDRTRGLQPSSAWTTIRSTCVSAAPAVGQRLHDADENASARRAFSSAVNDPNRASARAAGNSNRCGVTARATSASALSPAMHVRRARSGRRGRRQPPAGPPSVDQDGRAAAGGGLAREVHRDRGLRTDRSPPRSAATGDDARRDCAGRRPDQAWTRPAPAAAGRAPSSQRARASVARVAIADIHDRLVARSARRMPGRRTVAVERASTSAAPSGRSRSSGTFWPVDT